MAKVSLRAYNREIESMIEGGQLDEAVVHCQYILKAFPMHIETYRLLGKAFLEARRHTDAADIFQRALMAVPDDFVAHVGMSIIRDNEGRLDDAIWHMERAFEVQPSNPAIQGELRHLYGRRDGVEPPKIRLSRDALANMYSQGELFNQAIAEIRSVLAEDLNRPDLQVMLARAYYRAGQKVEAAEMAAALLKKYPYCMDALRVLVDVLPDATRSDNIRVYRRRLRLLDPYSSFATDSVFASDQVADIAVNLERLEDRAGAVPASSQPDWASSLGLKLAGEKRAEPRPDRMRTEKTTKPLPPFVPEPSEPSSVPTAEGGSVPDWMRAAGWQESTDTAQEGPLDSGEEPPAEPIPQADIPDWLKSMAPPEVTGAATAEPEPASAEVSSTDTEPVPAPAEISSTDAAALPDWLTGLRVGMAVETVAGSEQLQPEDQPGLVEEPAPILSSTTDETVPISKEIPPIQPPVERTDQPVKAEDDTMAWLEQLAVERRANPEEQPAASTPAESVPVTPGPAPEEDITITSWLSRLDIEEAAGKLPPASTSAEQPAMPLEELPDWLKDLDKPLAPSESIKTDGDSEVPVWEDENAPVSEQAAPTIPEEWVPAERPGERTAQPSSPDASTTETSAAVEPGSLSIETPVQPSIVQGTGMLARLPAQNKDAEFLSGAQAALEGHSLGDAMKEYGKLIKKGHLLDEVIHDLREAIDRYPVDAIVWQTLGDAYMRANRLQDALDAFTKAEELLR
jgi:tetratricopeptide (TPR) repeat protein